MKINFIEFFEDYIKGALKWRVIPLAILLHVYIENLLVYRYLCMRNVKNP
jgi:hypothetical protein